jgi:hypothetical protein
LFRILSEDDNACNKKQQKKLNLFKLLKLPSIPTLFVLDLFGLLCAEVIPMSVRGWPNGAAFVVKSGQKSRRSAIILREWM